MSDHACPTCGKALTTERGKRQHHTKVHGELPPNRTCPDCGTDFYDPKARRTYCDNCYSESGRKNGNWNDAMETTDCRRCGSEFEYYPSNKEGVYCPECVEDADEFLGEPSWKGKKTELVTTECEYCGGDVVMRASKRAYGSGRFCSEDCKYAWMSDNWRGEDHPRWGGGWDETRNRNWKAARRKTLRRDNHRCRNCGTSSEELGCEPDVHHIKPIREYDDPTEAHMMDNLITLCRACHMKVEHGKIPLPEMGQ